jgi:transposase
MKYSNEFQKESVATFLQGYQSKKYTSATKYAEDFLPVNHTIFINWLKKYDTNGIYQIRKRRPNKTKEEKINAIVPIELKRQKENKSKPCYSNTITISLTGAPLVTIGERASVEQIKNVLLALKKVN